MSVLYFVLYHTYIKFTEPSKPSKNQAAEIQTNAADDDDDNGKTPNSYGSMKEQTVSDGKVNLGYS